MKSNLYNKNKMVNMTETDIKEVSDILFHLNLAIQLNKDSVKRLDQALTDKKVPEKIDITEKTDVFDFINFAIKERKDFLENKIKTMEIIRGLLGLSLSRKRFDKQLFTSIKLYSDYNQSIIANL